MTSHEAYTIGTSRVLGGESLQRLKLEALIPALADCKVRSAKKFLNARSIAPIEIDRQLCQVCDHTSLDGQHISSRSSTWRYLIIVHPVARMSRPEISIFSHISRNSCPVSVSVFRMTERGRWMSHSGSNPRRQTSTTQHTKVGPTVWQMSQFRRWICLKNVLTLAVSVPVNLSIEFGFLSVNGPGKFTLWTRNVYQWTTRINKTFLLNFSEMTF